MNRRRNIKKKKEWGFPWQSRVKTPHSQCREHTQISGQGTKILPATR